MKKLILLLLTLLAVGCGQDLAPGAATAAPLEARLAHRGQLLLDGAQPLPFDLEFESAASGLTGQARVIFAAGQQAAYGPIAGSGPESFEVDLRPELPLLRFQGASSAQGLTGSFSELAPGALALGTGTYQTAAVTLDPPLAGRYTATLDDGTAIPLNLGPAPIDSANFPDVDLPTNPFLVYTEPFANNELTIGGGLASAYFFSVFNNSNFPFAACFFSGNASGGSYTAVLENGGTRQGTYTLTP